jgi:hypothetical protein
VLDLDTGVDLDKVVPSLLVHQELCRTGVSVPDFLGQLDGVGQDGLTDVLGEVRSRSDFHDLLVPSLH